jgi:hypothetical protein
MKDAKGHGSAAHGGGVDQIGRTPLTLPVWYHGSPTGEPGPTGAVHVGTAAAAKIALEARIGIPADGKGWNGDREYGKTLIAKNDYYPTERPTERPTMGHDKTLVPLDAKPSVAQYNITGHMNNTANRPATDDGANRRARSKAAMTGGLYYKNTGEDSGKVSAVVPDRTYLRKV